MAEHISVEELADAAEGLLASARADAVRSHLDGCPTCRDTADLLSSVSVTLAAEPPPAMPPDVVARLDGVLAQEQTRRQLKTDVPTSAGTYPWVPRPRLPAPAPLGPRRGRAVGWMLAAAGLAVAVGFGGYVLSARAGLNEPQTGAAAVSTGNLRNQARTIEQTRDVDPHRFSHAWSCARRVTNGKITGIVSVTVDGAPAYLVYVSAPTGQQAVIVRGCDEGVPRVTATAPLTR